MANWNPVLRTSEFWVGVVAAVLQFLVSQHLVSQQVSDYIVGATVYVVGRIISKVVKPAVPAK